MASNKDIYGSKSVMSNMIWRFLERCGAQGVTFIVSIVLARILDPADYGLVALVTVITTLMQVFVDSGFGSALMQKKNPDNLDYSSVFYFNVVFCLFLYAVMFFAAPLIAWFYDKSELVLLVRVISLIIPISALKNVQQSYVAKNMLFRKFFWATLGGTIGAAVIGITLAVLGYGVWALVWQMLFNVFVDTFILWIIVDWKPKWIFSFSRLRSLFKYGWKMLVSHLLDTTYNNLRSLIIGKKYESEDLAYYNKGNSFPNMFVTNINTSIDSVLLPSMASAHDNPEKVKAMTRRAIKTASFIIMPMMMGLAACATPMIRLLLTDKWLPCVFFLRVFCFTYAFFPIHTANLNAIKAMGRSDLFLKLEIIKKIIGITAILITMWISVEAMALSLLVVSVFNQIVNSWPNRRLLNYKYHDQLFDILPNIVLTIAMGAIVFSITFFKLPDWLTLTIQVPLGIFVYFFGAWIFRLDSFVYCKNMAKTFFSRKKSPKTDDKKLDSEVQSNEQISDSNTNEHSCSVENTEDGNNV